MNNFINSAASDEAILWFGRIQSGQCSEVDQQKFLDWLNQSPENQVEYLKVEQLWLSAARLEVTQKAGFFSGYKPLAVGAFACCALIALFFMPFNSVKSFDYETAVGEQKSIQLEDGSQLLLNTDTHLQVVFSKKTRKIILEKGETYFDVARNPDRPFDVVTTDGQVRVLGTHFSVRKLASDTQVSVVEGKVGVGELASDANSYQAKVKLEANQSITLKNAKAGESPQTINPSSVLAWKNHQLVFQNQSLGDVVNELQRYFPDEIILKDLNASSIRITGVLQLAKAEESFATLCESVKLICEVDKDKHQFFIGERR